MTAELTQGNFTHAKCLTCGHLGFIQSFEPQVVPFDGYDNGLVKFTITTPSPVMSLSVINMKCPVCESTAIEACLEKELN